MTLEPGRQLDRYRVEDKIGEGGFSVVYKVHHLALERDFALKLLKVDRSDLHERLLQEGRVQAKLAHPNVVAVRDVIEVDGVPGLILDWVEDGSLSRLLDHHRLTHHEIDRLAQGILEGVVAAHELGLVHRDLKPQNVLLERTSAGYVPKVADFGLARVLMPDHDMGTTGTRSGVVMGTPAYMAPEQIENAALADARSDVFALGAVLYELACGQVAFDGDKLADVLYHVANVRYRPLDELVPDLPERMRLTIAAALQERPDRRTQSAAEMLAMWRGEIRPERLPSITLPAPRAHPVAGAPEMGRLVRRLALVAAGTAAGSAAFVLFLFGQRADRRSEVPSAELVATPEVVPFVDQGPSPRPLDPDTATGEAAPPAPVAPPAVAEAPAPAPDGTVTAEIERLPPAPAKRGSPAVAIVGDGIEQVKLVRRADGRAFDAGAPVPDGLYDLLVWFVDEPEVRSNLGLRMGDGVSWTVSCNGEFYTCTAREGS